MNRRLQIIVSSQHRARPPGIAPRLGFWERFKLIIAGISIATVLVALLIVAAVLGSILAALLLVAVVAAVVVLVVRASLKRVSQ